MMPKESLLLPFPRVFAQVHITNVGLLMEQYWLGIKKK
jgi:hypothetical protein